MTVMRVIKLHTVISLLAKTNLVITFARMSICFFCSNAIYIVTHDV